MDVLPIGDFESPFDGLLQTNGPKMEPNCLGPSDREGPTAMLLRLWIARTGSLGETSRQSSAGGTVFKRF